MSQDVIFSKYKVLSENSRARQGLFNHVNLIIMMDLHLVDGRHITHFINITHMSKDEYVLMKVEYSIIIIGQYKTSIVFSKAVLHSYSHLPKKTLLLLKSLYEPLLEVLIFYVCMHG